MSLNKKPAGFTLVELLVSLSLVTVIFAALMATFYGGMQVWDRSECMQTQGSNLQLAFEKMRKDIRNSLTFNLIETEGRYDEFVFATKLPLETTEDLNDFQIGRVAYYLDKQSRVLCRSAVAFKDMRRQKIKAECQILAEGIDRVRFKYYLEDTEEGEAKWKGSLREDERPSVVRIETRYTDDCSGEEVEKNYDVLLP